MKRKLFKISTWVISLFVVTIAGVTIARYHTISDIPAPNQEPHLQVFLSGKKFEPEKEYHFKLDNGDILELKTDTIGNFEKSYVIPFDIGTSDIIRFILSEDNNIDTASPSLEILFDTEKENINWKGRFFTPSQDVKLSISDSESVNFKADWNGHFIQNISYKGINILKENSCFKSGQKEREFCISFNVHRSAKVIKAFTVGSATPGTAFDDPFSPFDNWSIPSDCDPGNFGVELSLCDTSHVAGLQEDLSKIVYDFSRMTLQLSAGMMQQVGFIGTLFDAKHQLETQLLFWEKQERAHEDYHPSEQLCSIASITQELAMAEEIHERNTFILNRALSYEDQNPINTSTAKGPLKNYQVRALEFRETYCAPTNINTSLRTFCDALSSGNVARMNRDIDYQSLVSLPKTLEINFTDGITSSADEQDVLSMGRLLFGHTTFNWPNPGDGATDVQKSEIFNDPEYINRLQEFRSMSAIRDVARNSYANLVSMKAEGSGFVNTEIEGLLSEFGMSADDIDRFAGENPSYFAQMHMLTKQIYQHPNFYSNLITKEANISRFEVTMEAMQLMSKRDRFDAALRKEMLLSLIVEMKLRDLQEKEIDVGLRNSTARNVPAGR